MNHFFLKQSLKIPWVWIRNKKTNQTNPNLWLMQLYAIYFILFFLQKRSSPLFKMHYFLCHVEKTFYPAGITDTNLGWMQPQHRNYLDWGNCSYIYIWHGTFVQFRGAGVLCIVNGKSKAPIPQTINSSKVGPLKQMWILSPIKWGLSPILKWKLRQMETAVNTARFLQGAV